MNSITPFWKEWNLSTAKSQWKSWMKALFLRTLRKRKTAPSSGSPEQKNCIPPTASSSPSARDRLTKLVNTTKGLKANSRGLLEADEEGHTSRPEIFASGDVVNGARTVVEAVAHSKIVAEAMDAYMQSLPKDAEDETP